MTTPSIPWMVSLHGGHSGAYCDHAEGPLRAFVEAAIAAGSPACGITEHAPRVEEARLYAEEIARGWNTGTLEDLFAAYAVEVHRLKHEYASQITILAGFEAEVIPEDRYVELMRGYRERFAFDYMVGSVHWVAGHIIDYRIAHFERALAACGGLEAMAVRYYETLACMADALQPEVIGHFDLVRRNAPDEASVSTPPIREAALAALDAIARNGGILDVNTGGYRKGLGRPYPAPWIVKAALERGIGFCFGDDSHRPEEVCAGIPEARDYLIKLGVKSIRPYPCGIATLGCTGTELILL